MHRDRGLAHRRADPGGEPAAAPRSRLGPYLTLARPFTLVMPALGMLSGGIMAFGARSGGGADLARFVMSPWARVGIGVLMAVTLNAASNVLNQIHDVDIDRVNKPDRVLPRGLLSRAAARRFAAVLYAAAILLAVPVGWACTAIVVLTAALTWAYSAPPLRLKRLLLVSNLTIALPRGVLLKVAGWSAVGAISGWEPWFIGLVFGVFVFGAVSTKDLADVEGDRRFGCVTVPVRFGARATAWIVAPFLVAPSVLTLAGLGCGWLSGDRRVLVALAVLLVPWALYVLRLMLREEAQARLVENQPSWTHMYLMSFVMQIGFAAAYVV